MRSSGAGFIWPTLWQEVLLDIATAPDAQARAAFQKWFGRDLTEADFDAGSRRLLPLVYHRARSLSLNDPTMGRLKGMLRRTWYQNNAAFPDYQAAVARLEGNGIETLLLKGVPLALTCYANPALRPMADIDILVRPAKAEAAMNLLIEAGWRPYQAKWAAQIDFRHSMGLENPAGRQIDLHWHVLLEGCNRAADERFWSSAAPLVFAGVATRQLDATNMLLHVIIHGIRWNRAPAIRWIADALAVLDHAQGRIDWPGLVAFARAQCLTHRLGLGLEYLARRYRAAVPDWVLRELAAAGISLTERIENSVILRDYERMFAHPFGKFWSFFAEYCRVAHGRADFVPGFARYLRLRVGAEGHGRFAAVLLRGAWRSVAGHAG
jgi:hypothetical protein